MTYSEKLKSRALRLYNGPHTVPSADEVCDILGREFPGKKIPDARTIRRWKANETRVMAVVAESRQPTTIDPMIAKRREEHFEQLAITATILLQGNLHTVQDVSSGGTNPPEYMIFTEERGDESISHEKLASALVNNLANLVDTEIDSVDFDSLMEHLKAELPEVPSNIPFPYSYENPYEVIDALKILSKRKTFKGKCAVCKDW
jgi:hypothetical protein